MILLRLTDYNDDLMYHFSSLLTHFIVACLDFSLTNHVTVCVCQAELKGYLLAYLHGWQNERMQVSPVLEGSQQSRVLSVHDSLLGHRVLVLCRRKRKKTRQRSRTYDTTGSRC